MPDSISSRSSYSSSHNSIQERSRSRSRSNSSSQHKKRKIIDSSRKYSGPKYNNRGGGRGTFRNQRDRTKKPAIDFPSLDFPLMEVDKFVQEFKSNDLSDDKIKRIYLTYKKHWENKQKEIFFLSHKDEVWIQDKYNPENRYRIQEERNKLAKFNYQQFVKNYNLGKYDSINLTVTNDQIQELIMFQNRIHVDIRDAPFQEHLIKENLQMDLSDEPYFMSDPNINTLFIKNVPSLLSRWQVWEIVSQYPGFLNLSISAPVKTNENQRMAWIGFDSEQSVNYVLNLNGGILKIKNHSLQMIKQLERKKFLRVCSNIDANKLYRDYVVQRELIECLDLEKNLEGNPLTQGPLRDRDDPAILRQLDVQTLYLRRVHSYCYWSAGEFTDERALYQKCGCMFLRLVNNEVIKSTDNAPIWQECIQQLAKKRIECSINRDNLVQPFQEVLDKEIMKVLKKKSQRNNKLNMEIFPCDQCPKQFKGPDFLIRHIQNKHQEQYDDIYNSTKANVVNSCMLDIYKQEKQSKVKLQKIIFGGQGFPDDFITNANLVLPLNFAPRPQYRIYKDLDNMQTEKTIPQNIVLPLKTSTINYNDI